MNQSTYEANRLQITHEAVWRRMHSILPMGWKNDFESYRMIRDPELFPKLRKVWDLVLAGQPIQKVLVIANDELGIRTPRHGMLGGKPLHRTAVYKMLTDPFYAGFVRFKGKLVRGLHEPMVTEEEYLRVQRLLQKRRRNRGTEGQKIPTSYGEHLPQPSARTLSRQECQRV